MRSTTDPGGRIFHPAAPSRRRFRIIPTDREKSDYAAQTHRAGDLVKYLRVSGKSRDFLKTLRNRPRIRGVAYFAPRAT